MKKQRGRAKFQTGTKPDTVNCRVCGKDPTMAVREYFGSEWIPVCDRHLTQEVYRLATPDHPEILVKPIRQ